MNQNVEENTSGHGKAATIPPGVSGWSWGAFFLNWIWGLGNSVYIALLVFIPFVNIVMPFVLGAKGREWAWRARRWESVEHFKKVQRRWGQVGVGLFLVTVIGIVLSMMGLFHSMTQSTPSQLALSMASKNQQVVMILGNPIQSHTIRVGSLESNMDGTGSANLTLPLTGSKGSGMLAVKACEIGKQWYIVQLTFQNHANGQFINLTPQIEAPCQYQDTSDSDNGAMGMTS